MHVAVGEGINLADSFLSERTRDAFHWYARGFLSANEALLLIGQACLNWAELASRGSGQACSQASRDAV